MRPTTVTVLDREATPRLKGAIESCLTTYPAADALYIDMVNVTRCDAEGASVLADAVQTMRRRQGKTILMNVQDGPYEVLNAVIHQDATAVITRTSDSQRLHMDVLQPLELSEDRPAS